MRDDLNYGPILITKGQHKGKIGYFDDTDIDGKLIVYRKNVVFSMNFVGVLSIQLHAL